MIGQMVIDLSKLKCAGDLGMHLILWNSQKNS